MAGSPGMAGDSQGQCHRMAEGLDVSTEQKRDGDAVLLCVHAGRREPSGEKKRQKKKGGETTADNTSRRRDRKGRLARATRRPQVTRTARGTAQERGAGKGGERPVLGARTGPRMDEDQVGPRHGVAGGSVGYKHGMRDGMGLQDSPGD